MPIMGPAEQPCAGASSRNLMLHVPASVMSWRCGHIVLLTGGPEAGKTLLCRRVSETARHRGLRVTGLITEAHRLASGRLVQTALNLRTGERRRLADYVGVDEGEPIGGGVAGRLSWTFVGESVRWGRHELDRCLAGACDLLIVDQLGPLELLAGSGWVNAVRVLEEARYGLALVVVNPLVVEELRRRLGDVDVVRLGASAAGGASATDVAAGADDLEEQLVRLALTRRLEPEY